MSQFDRDVATYWPEIDLSSERLHYLLGIRRDGDLLAPEAHPDRIPQVATALAQEVLRLRAVEADAERARVKAELWSYYEAFVAANGAGSITELVTQRDEARAEAATMRSWAEEAAKAENENAEDAQKERAAVVAWLREQRAFGTDALLGQGFATVCGILSDAIERGEHRREEE